MLTIFLRAIILYALTLVTLRAMGKHQLGQFQPYEFAMAIMIADLMATPMSNISTPLLHGVLPVAALFIIHSLLTYLCMRSDKLRSIISGKPSVVMTNGVVDKNELSKLSLSLSDLLEGLREAGIMDPSKVGTALIEANGRITAFPPSQERPLTPKDMSIQTPYEGLPLVLIMDGRVQKNNLRQAGKDEAWLSELLALYNLDFKQVLLTSLDTCGKMHLQDTRGATLSIEAMNPKEVCW